MMHLRSAEMWGRPGCVTKLPLPLVPLSPARPHRITEWSGLAGTSVGHPTQPPAEAETTTQLFTLKGLPHPVADHRHYKFSGVTTLMNLELLLALCDNEKIFRI